MRSYDIFEKCSSCVGGTYHSQTIYKKPATSFHKKKKIRKKIILLKCDCSLCRRTKTKIVSDNKNEVEGLGKFFKHLGKGASKATKS